MLFVFLLAERLVDDLFYKWNTVKFISNILDSKYVGWILVVLNTVSSLALSPSATAFLE